MAAQPLLPVFLLSLCILPISLWLGVTLSVYVKIRPYFTRNWPSSSLAVRKRVLLTGDDDGAVLSTARVLQASGSTVFVVKQERIPYTNCLWTSKAVHKYVGLASGRLTPIFRRLTKGIRFTFGMPSNLPGTTLNLVESEKIDLWIHCDSTRSSIAHVQAKEIVLKHSTTKLFEPDVDTTRLARGYSLFAHHMRHHETEVHCPKTVFVRSRAEIHEVLWKAPRGQQYQLERSDASFATITKASGSTKRDSGYDDSSTLVDASSDSDDFEGVDTSTPIGEYAQLPQATPNQTYSAVASMQISPVSPWIMHEIIWGKPGTISALVVNGKIKAFAAQTAPYDRNFSTAACRSPLSTKKSFGFNAKCNVKDWKRDEETSFVDPTSTIGTALLCYAERFAASLSEKPSTFLNLHFFLTDRSTSDGAEQKIVATGCDFSFSPVLAHQALASGVGEVFGRAMIRGGEGVSVEDDLLLLPTSSSERLVEVNAGWPALKLPRSTTPRGDSLNALASSLEELINERDARYDHDDLVPWIWFWLVQGPIEVAFEGLVEILENAQTRGSGR